jgi:ethanolamine utilization protein EutP
MKGIIFVGKQGAGKTTLIQKLMNLKLEYKKTQTIEYYPNIIDTPGEYLENPRFYNAIITLSFDANLVALVHDCTSNENYFPPGFGTMFNKRVVGIITKVESERADVERSEKLLKNAGATEIFKVSAYTNEGIEQIAALF